MVILDVCKAGPGVRVCVAGGGVPHCNRQRLPATKQLVSNLLDQLQRCETDCAAFILLAFKAKGKLQKELPQEKGIILGLRSTNEKKTTRAAFHSEL